MPIFVAIVFLLVGVVVYFVVRSRATPPVAMFQEIRTTLLELQRIASQNIFPLAQTRSLTGFDQDKMAQQCRHVQETIRYVYTIEEAENGVVHTISSQLLKPKPEKYQIQCMLIVMLTLNERLKESGIDPKSAQFSIDKSPTGTHYVSMSLSQALHDQMMAVNA